MAAYLLFALLAFCSAQSLSPAPTPCLAPPGNFCSGGAVLICPPGSYCTGGGAVPVMCPPGSFSSTSGASTFATCKPCTVGSYAASAGLSACSVCPAGMFCAVPQSLLFGVYRGSITASSSAYGVVTADIFAPGYCAAEGIRTVGGCVYSASISNAVVDMQLEATNSTSFRVIWDTAGGHDTGVQFFYQTISSGGWVSLGSVGSSSAGWGSHFFTSPLPITNFRYRCVGTNWCKVDYVNILECPDSHCPLSSINPIVCPIATFSNAGAASCTPCSSGSFASSIGSTLCQQCPGGHYCPSNTSSWAHFINCGRGNYCPTGSGTPIPCPYQMPPSGGWGALQDQGPAFLVETAQCLNQCFWNQTSVGALGNALSKC